MADLPAGSESGTKKLADPEQAAKDCDVIESDLASLRAAYEQYFLGIERKPPTLEHGRMKKRLSELKGAFIRQTAVKFRVSNLHTKFSTYERLWSRTLQEMENGTYHRDIFKARLHAKKRSEAQATAPPPVADPAGPAAAPAPKPASAAGELPEAKLKAIYEAYVTAKRRCNEDTSKLSFNALAATLKRQIPELLKQHKAKSVDFKVVIKDGRAVLRAVPRE